MLSENSSERRRDEVLRALEKLSTSSKGKFDDSDNSSSASASEIMEIKEEDNEYSNATESVQACLGEESCIKMIPDETFSEIEITREENADKKYT